MRVKTSLLLIPILVSYMYAQSSHKVPQRMQARSMVVTKFGIVATTQTLASQAGSLVLARGGSAVDAAIAANAVLGLVEPMSNGVGGDLFAIVYEARTGKLHGLNASGWSPSGMTLAFLASKNITGKMPARGIHTATIPGAVAGWHALREKFGKLTFADILSPAIYFSEKGFPLTELIAEGWTESVGLLSGQRYAKETYLPDGVAPKLGQIFRNADLGKTYRAIAAGGRDGFYRGSVANAILQLSRENGGIYTAEDLSTFEPEWVDPISTTYRGWKVTELPPNGQGIAALSMLNIMERFPLADYGQNSAKALHVMIEAKKLAYADMLRYVGDPRFSQIPVEQMLSKHTAGQRAKLIHAGKASPLVAPGQFDSITKAPGGDTIYLAAIDSEGNIVSLIQSLYQGFGSGLVPPHTGFVMQNRGALFSLERGHPNEIQPHKRPLHTIIPAFLEKDGVRMGFGIMGGWNQAQAHAQFVSNVVDFGMNVQAALESPRFTKLTFDGVDVSVESRFPGQVLKELRSLGHKVSIVAPYSGAMGRGQAVWRDLPNGVNYGASDPRGDGAAVPEGPPVFPIAK
ncbi:MAG: gamma-glutamyltransferase [Bryobacteraceae bacterium]